VIGPCHLRHHGADGVELACLDLDSRSARQVNDHTVRGRHHRDRPKDAVILRNGGPISAIRDGRPISVFRGGGPASAIRDGRPISVIHDGRPASVIRDSGPISATGCAIFRTQAPLAAPLRPEPFLPIVERGLGHTLGGTEPRHRQAGIEKTPESTLPQRGLLPIRRTSHHEPPGHPPRPSTRGPGYPTSQQWF
jgi:hypothetical protein